MKSIIVDSSSAILLYKSGWLDATLNKFHLQSGQAVYRELTIPGYPGAKQFKTLAAAGRIEILPLVEDPPAQGVAGLKAMGPGERECIEHFLAGIGHFILLDDGRAAHYCRDKRLPYINALLIPRILALADPAIGAQTVLDAMALIGRLGRYADGVREYARNCQDAALAPFLP
jgi:hypothetical protein